MTKSTGTDPQIYLVGGAVRDILMSRWPKDYDFSVVAESFEQMESWLLDNAFVIFLRDEDHFTIRAKRKHPWSFGGIDMTNKTFDFVLARKEGAYSDARHPDTVEPGTLLDDLSRRDFTMNAIAMDSDGEFIDPFDGAKDIEQRRIRCVGGVERLYEDGLRMVRALRFSIQLDFDIAPAERETMKDPLSMQYLKGVSVERIREELLKCFAYNTLETLWQLGNYIFLRETLLSGMDLWLKPTLEKR